MRAASAARRDWYSSLEIGAGAGSAGTAHAAGGAPAALVPAAGEGSGGAHAASASVPTARRVERRIQAPRRRKKDGLSFAGRGRRRKNASATLGRQLRRVGHRL